MALLNRRGEDDPYGPIGAAPFEPSPEDELAQIYGIDPDYQEPELEQFEPTGYQRFLEQFSTGLQGVQAPRPRNFLEGLLVGTATGLGNAGSRVAKARAQFELKQQERNKQTDADRREATRRYREAKSGDVLSRLKEERAAATKAIEQPKELQRIEDEAKARAVGTRKAAEGQPETPAEKRARATAERAEAAAQRQADAADRQARLAQVQTIGGLADDYRIDPAIKGYRNVKVNLRTAESGAKEKSGPGDIALVFSFMRALEPENPNVVREGEYANARTAAGALQKYVNLPARFFKGTQLTDEGRGYFLKTMRGQLNSRKADFELANTQYKRRAEAGGVDPTLFIYDDEIGSANSRTRPPLSSFER